MRYCLAKVGTGTKLQQVQIFKQLLLIRIYICGCLKYIILVKLKITIFNEY